MTLVLIAVTIIISILSFNRLDLFDKLKFNPYLIVKHNQYYRFLSYGLVHADWAHLFINMFVLYSFGGIVLEFLTFYFGFKANIYYLILYVGGLAFSTLFDFGKYKDNPYYNAVGASGAVSAIVFSSIVLYPQGKIFLFFIPIGIPAPLFGIIYLVYSAYMAKRSNDNIGHSAHFWGAIYGFLLTMVLHSENFVQIFKF